ncbi:MAG: hypothetical protein F2524_01400 [Actinobacteria bacterium]|nr:hypothetical protein [Actinomycetota bacterium]
MWTVTCVDCSQRFSHIDVAD